MSPRERERERERGGGIKNLESIFPIETEMPHFNTKELIFRVKVQV